MTYVSLMLLTWRVKVMKRMEGAYGGIRETTGAEEREAIIPIVVKPSNNLERCFTRQK